MPTSDQAQLWLEMAKETRVAAGSLSDQELRRQLLIIAAGYEALARRMESLSRGYAPANSNETPQFGH